MNAPLRTAAVAILTLATAALASAPLSGPATVATRVADLLKAGKPGQALRTLSSEGQDLTTSARAALARRAVGVLVAYVSAAADPAAALAEVRQARAAARGLDDHADRVLGALEAQLEHQRLDRDCKALADLGGQGSWDQAGTRASEALREHPDLPAPLARALTDLATAGTKLCALERLEGKLRLGDKLSLADDTDLPARLRQLLTGLRGLAELQAAADGRWQIAPDVARLKQSLADFQSVAQDNALTGRLQQDLAVKTFLQGYPREACALLPADGPPGHAAELLGDLRALLLGGGEVTTWPAVSAAAAAPAKVEPPGGLRPLVPSRAVGWQPPRRQAGQGPTPLAVAAVLGRRWHQRAGTFVKREWDRARRRGADALRVVQDSRKKHRQDEEDDQPFLADLAKRLGRPAAAAECALAWQQRRQGQSAAQVAAGLRQAEQAPLDSAEAYCERAGNHLKTKAYDLAVADYDQAIALAPKDAAAYRGRGDAHSWQCAYDKAVADYDQALTLDPDNPVTYARRAAAFRLRKDYDKALADYNRAIRLNPKAAEPVVGRGHVYRKKGEYAHALAEFMAALKLAPDDADAQLACAWLLATCPDDKIRDAKKALACARKAAELAGNKEYFHLASLAAAHAAAGDFAAAVRLQTLALAAPYIPADELEEMRARLGLYEQGRPYREPAAVLKASGK
jgi:tetratricopeptide (TPR) repeat protein